MEFEYLLMMVFFFGDMYKEEIKEYIKTFKLKEKWHHVVYFTIILNIIIMAILIVTYRT